MTMDMAKEREKACWRLKNMQPEYGAVPLGDIAAAVMGGSYTVCEYRDRLIELLGGNDDWLESETARKCGELQTEVATLDARIAMLQSAMDEQGDELARVLRERNEGWMKLPVDMDGVPIRVGDEVQQLNHAGEWMAALPVVAVDGNGCFVLSQGADSEVRTYVWDNNCRHAKPRTLEDVLRELADEVIEWSGYSGPVSGDRTWSGMAKKYADEIRELTEVER
jgi:hypothetical protein